MQTAFPVKMPPGVALNLENLAKDTSRRAGVRASWEAAAPGTNSNVIVFGDLRHVHLAVLSENKWAVLYNGNPNYFEWAVIQELAALGGDLGNSSIPPEMSGTWADYQAGLQEKKPWWKWW